MSSNSEGLKVITPGFLSLLVDSGRKVSQAEGFCQSGPMDSEAFTWANWLVDNATYCSIEILGEAEFLVEIDMSIAVTGSNVMLSINDSEKDVWRTVEVKKGDVLKVSTGALGKRAYLSTSATWTVSRQLGSLSCVIREKLGGLDGQGTPLKASDVIPMQSRSCPSSRFVPPRYRPEYSLNTPIDVILGYQNSQFDEVQRQSFFLNTYKISSKISRMGYRLEGPVIKMDARSMYSEGINLGAIQIPSDGQPIIMMCDRQTLGGYPKIGCVASYDIPRIAHATPGDKVTFSPIDNNNARAKQLLRWQKPAQLLENSSCR